LITTSAASQAWSAEGWADVLSTGASLTGFCIFRSTTLGEGIAPLQTQTAPATLILPFDNTAGQHVMGIALGNIATTTTTATVTVSAWDVNGNSLLTAAPVEYHASDPASHGSTTWPAGGHDAFMLNTAIPQTTGIRGIVRFQIGGGALTGVGLRVGLAQSTFTSAPVTLQ